MALRDLKPEMYCTVLDVLMQFKGLKSDKVNLMHFDSSDVNIVRYGAAIERDIVMATAMVRSMLVIVYGQSGLEASPSYAGIPIRNISVDAQDNAGDAALNGAQVSADAFTEWWKIQFTDDTNYTVTGSATGSDGTGAKGADFTSTSGALILNDSTLSGLFSGTMVSGYIFYVSSYKHHQIVNAVTAMLAAAYALQNEYVAEIPNESDFATSLEDRAMDWLKKLSDPHKTGVSLDVLPPQRDTSDIQLPYFELFDPLTGIGPFSDDLATDDYDGYNN